MGSSSVDVVILAKRLRPSRLRPLDDLASTTSADGPYFSFPPIN